MIPNRCGCLFLKATLGKKKECFPIVVLLLLKDEERHSIRLTQPLTADYRRMYFLINQWHSRI